MCSERFDLGEIVRRDKNGRAAIASGIPVVDDRVTCLQQVIQHRAAHDAKADESYGCYCGSPLCGSASASLALVKPCGDILGTPSQKADIAAYGCEVEPEIEEMLDVINISR